jgi:hypothetical protein
MVATVGISLLSFAVVTAIAELAGAANLGTALGFGQIAFAVALVAMMLRPTQAPARERQPGSS